MVCIPNILLNDTINGIIDNILRTVIELEYSGPNKMLIIGPANINTPIENISPNMAANFVNFLIIRMLEFVSFLLTVLLMNGYNACDIGLNNPFTALIIFSAIL